MTDELNYGTPFPGADLCTGDGRGHEFLDGMCMHCSAYSSGQRERFDHFDHCPFWRGGQCIDCVDLIGDEAVWYTLLRNWKNVGEAANGRLEFFRDRYSTVIS